MRLRFGRAQLEPLLRIKAKENQGKRTDIPQKSAECFKPTETRLELAKAAHQSRIFLSFSIIQNGFCCILLHLDENA